MSDVASNLLEKALALPYDERAQFADCLMESLHPPVDEGKDEAYWKNEIARRLQEYDSGEVQGMTWKEVRSLLLRKEA